MDTVLTRLRTLKELENKFENHSDLTQENVNLALEIANSIKKTIASEALFSSNELLEDLPTEHIPLLLTPYYQAQVLLHNNDQTKRQESIQYAEACFEEFLENLDSYRVIEEDFKLRWKSAKDPTRDQKIQEFKQKKELQAAIENLEQRGQEDLRELYQKQLELAAVESLNQLRFIKLESHLLLMKDQPLPKPKQSSAPQVLKIDESNIHQLPSMLSSSSLSSVKEQLKAQVFKPAHNLPTMTVEEYGEMKAKQMQEQTPPPPQEDSDDEEAQEKKRKKQADWDDWKDAHEKGAGNRMGR